LQVDDLLPVFDWALSESCFRFNECDRLLPFIAAGKAVFHVEYDLDTAQFCPRASAMHFNSMKKHRLLDAYREPCDRLPPTTPPTPTAHETASALPPDTPTTTATPPAAMPPPDMQTTLATPPATKPPLRRI